MARKELVVVFNPPLDVHDIHEISLIHYGEGKHIDEVFVRWGDSDGACVRATRRQGVWRVDGPVIADGKWTSAVPSDPA